MGSGHLPTKTAPLIEDDHASPVYLHQAQIICIIVVLKVLKLPMCQVLTKNCHIMRGRAWLLTIRSLIVLNFIGAA